MENLYYGGDFKNEKRTWLRNSSLHGKSNIMLKKEKKKHYRKK